MLNINENLFIIYLCRFMSIVLKHISGEDVRLQAEKLDYRLRVTFREKFID